MKGLPQLRETVVMPRIYRLLSLGLLPILMGFCFLGCGPITASQAISDARTTVDQAQIAAENAREVERKRLAAEERASEKPDAVQDSDSARKQAILEKARASLRGQLHFELASAIAYINKAREEEGYSDYRSAARLASRAEAFAEAALDVADAIRRDSAAQAIKAKSETEPEGAEK